MGSAQSTSPRKEVSTIRVPEFDKARGFYPRSAPKRPSDFHFGITLAGFGDEIKNWHARWRSSRHPWSLAGFGSSGSRNPAGCPVGRLIFALSLAFLVRVGLAVLIGLAEPWAPTWSPLLAKSVGRRETLLILSLSLAWLSLRTCPELRLTPPPPRAM